MKRQLKYAFPVLTCLLVCACGQKGPLFLPGDRSQVHTELPRVDREALEDALEDDEEEGTPPATERPESTDDEAEPFIDPASPRSPTGDDQ
jgi:predicted small lipoprotein YifL